MKKIAILGSRNEQDYKKVETILNGFNFKNCLILSGGAGGIDYWVEKYTKKNKIPFKKHVPDYGKHGKLAPILRNEKIIKECESVLFLWNGESKGTRDSLQKAIKLKKNILIKFI